ncbi:hypothetical protein ACMA1D_01785 [Streptomyces sp. 796.1]|uniref:hypothetical protein n=1 Tax=Streptomyces sp. 796.1 TaxID=3163029 RepID=UPI0039C9EDB9
MTWAPPDGAGRAVLPLGLGAPWVLVRAPAGIHHWMVCHSTEPMIRAPGGASAWLLDAAALAGWERRYEMLLPHIRLVTSGTAVVPGAGCTRGPGLHWVRPRGLPPEQWVADVLCLADDLATACVVRGWPLGPLPP